MTDSLLVQNALLEKALRAAWAWIDSPAVSRLMQNEGAVLTPLECEEAAYAYRKAVSLRELAERQSVGVGS